MSSLIENTSLMGFLNHVNGDMFLPMIQRGYEWDEERIEKFLDSLIKRLPVGLVLLYEHDGSFEIYGRKFFEKFDENIEKEQYKYDIKIDPNTFLVFDGQQRVQSLYLALNGTYYEKCLYHNVFWQKSESFNDVSFIFRKKDKEYFRENDSLYIKFPTLIKIADRISRGSSTRSIKEGIMEFKNMLGEFQINDVDNEQLEEFYFYLKENIVGTFFNTNTFNDLIKIQFARQKQLRELLETFSRFNSGGLKLEKSDLLFAVLKMDWRNIEDEMRELSENTGVPKDMLLKGLIITSGMSAKTEIYEAFEKIEQLKQDFEKFKNIVTQFEERLCDATSLTDRIVKKFNFLIPAVYFLYKNPHLLRNRKLKVLPKLLDYIFIVKYNSNLRSDTHLDNLMKIIFRNNDPHVFPYDELVKYFSGHGVKTIIDENSLNSDIILFFSMIQKGNWKPRLTGNTLHIDHIFPKAKANMLPEGAEEYIDTIWNKYVVFEGDNLSKNEALPEDYFVGERESLIDNYILPHDRGLLKTQNFFGCLKWRQEKLKDMFRQNLNIDLHISHIIEG